MSIIFIRVQGECAADQGQIRVPCVPGLQVPKVCDFLDFMLHTSGASAETHSNQQLNSKLVNFELGNIPQKCRASVRLSFVICSLPPKSFLCSASHTPSRRAPPHALGGPSQQTRGKLNPLRKCTQPVLLNGLLNRWASFPSLCWI